jgi:hypothetical protein
MPHPQCAVRRRRRRRRRNRRHAGRLFLFVEKLRAAQFLFVERCGMGALAAHGTARRARNTHTHTCTRTHTHMYTHTHTHTQRACNSRARLETRGVFARWRRIKRRENTQRDGKNTQRRTEITRRETRCVFARWRRIKRRKNTQSDGENTQRDGENTQRRTERTQRETRCVLRAGDT